MMNVTPIFILEGEAPALKLDTLTQRNNRRFRRFKKKPKLPDDDEPVTCSQTSGGGRKRFKGMLKQCKDMLEFLGVSCLQSEGEAEALCGQLNRDGVSFHTRSMPVLCRILTELS